MAAVAIGVANEVLDSMDRAAGERPRGRRRAGGTLRLGGQSVDVAGRVEAFIDDMDERVREEP